MTNQNEYPKSTKLVVAHYGEEYEHYYNAIVPPVFMNSLNVFQTLDDYYDFNRTDKHKYCYGRAQNPTMRILEDKITALEHGASALAFASGMATATTAVLTACKAGSHVVCLHNAYGPLKDFLSKHYREHLDITLTYVTGDTVEEFGTAVTDATDLIVLENPSSAMFSLQGIRAVSRIAGKHQALVYIDSTFCTPIYQQPLDLGVDIVMHTISKYIGGRNDIIGGMLAVKDGELMKKLTANRELLGEIVGPMEAWLVIRGLRTMEVRLAAYQAAAMEVAKFLEAHPRVHRVNYLGLPSHPRYELMKQRQTGNTGLMSSETHGTTEDAIKVVESLKVFKIGVSWDGFESLVFLPHARLDEETYRVLGAAQNVIRIHCGLEGIEALISDLKSALAKIQKRRGTVTKSSEN